MTPKLKIFSTAEASKYLGIAVSTIKHHIHITKALKADGKFGQSLYFTRETLDQFIAQKRKPGRPKQS